MLWVDTQSEHPDASAVCWEEEPPKTFAVYQPSNPLHCWSLTCANVRAIGVGADIFPRLATTAIVDRAFVDVYDTATSNRHQEKREMEWQKTPSGRAANWKAGLGLECK